MLMTHYFSAAFAQLPDPRFLRVALFSLAAGVVVIAAIWFGLHQAALLADLSWMPNWLAAMWVIADGWIVGLLALGLGLLIFAGVATAVMGLFLDSIVDAVEERHYPDNRAPRTIGAGESARMALVSGVRMILVNLLLAPVYLLLLFTAIGPFLLYLAVNGWLLGRDLMEMVLVRHRDRPATRALLSSSSGAVLTVGVLTASLLLVPLVGLMAPLFGAALATHVVHGLLARHPASHSART